VERAARRRSFSYLLRGQREEKCHADVVDG
jgi:hypothetical protein